MAHCISENKYRDLWKDVHKVRSKSRVGSQCMVDDVTGNENITQLFAHKCVASLQKGPHVAKIKK